MQADKSRVEKEVMMRGEVGQGRRTLRVKGVSYDAGRISSDWVDDLFVYVP